MVVVFRRPRVHPLPTPRPASPLWQKVSLCSSPVSMLATHKSLLLIKEKKAGSAGQILGSIRGPEHWVLISRGFMGDTCRQRGLAQWGRRHQPFPRPLHQRAWLTMKPFFPPSRQWKRLLLAWKRKRPLSLWKS